MDPIRLGSKIRMLRRGRGLSQRELADRLAISPSYLNLLEQDKRPVRTDLLLKLAQVLDFDLRTLGVDDAQLTAVLLEIAANPLFEDHPVSATEVREMVAAHPGMARMLQHLHGHYLATRQALETLGAQLLEDEPGIGGVDHVRLASEQVSDFFERHGNHFPMLEEAAENLWTAAGLDHEGLFGQLKDYLERQHQVSVTTRREPEMGGAVRRYVPDRRELHLSDAIGHASRRFQLAVQFALLSCGPELDLLTRDDLLTSAGSRELCRVALANYLAAAVLMPYKPFLLAAEAARYDIELLGRRFDVGWEQTCHRLTTLRRPGAEGVVFYLLRVDMAGNISKRFSAAGIRFPRFSGLCTLWNVHAAFSQPGRVRTQVSVLPDGHAVLAVARTVRRDVGSYHPSEILYSVGVGCDVSQARRLVYSDAMNLDNLDGAVPIGITCGLCERTNCAARAFPSVREPLRIDENVRGVSFFASVDQ